MSKMVAYLILPLAQQALAWRLDNYGQDPPAYSLDMDVHSEVFETNSVRRKRFEVVFKLLKLDVVSVVNGSAGKDEDHGGTGNSKALGDGEDAGESIDSSLKGVLNDIKPRLKIFGNGEM